MYEYDELTKAVKNPGSMQMTAAEAQRRQKHSETSFKLLNEELKSDFLKVLDFRGTTSTAMIALYFDPLADLFANGSHVIQRGEESLSKNGRNVGEDLRVNLNVSLTTAHHHSTVQVSSLGIRSKVFILF